MFALSALSNRKGHPEITKAKRPLRNIITKQKMFLTLAPRRDSGDGPPKQTAAMAIILISINNPFGVLIELQVISFASIISSTFRRVAAP
jgi:hypothetical protein